MGLGWSWGWVEVEVGLRGFGRVGMQLDGVGFDDPIRMRAAHCSREVVKVAIMRCHPNAATRVTLCFRGHAEKVVGRLQAMLYQSLHW